jgi:Holliday junction resolvase RusA-like endonuclease
MLRNGDKNISLVYDKQKKEKEMIRWQLMPQFTIPKISSPIAMEITFGMPIPKSASNALREQMIAGEVRHMKRPDIDNLTKFYLDTMNDFIFVDDCQICSLKVNKVFSEQPSTIILITPLIKNVLQDKADEVLEREDEYNLRDPRWGEDHRSCVDKKRYVFNTGEDDQVKPV